MPTAAPPSPAPANAPREQASAAVGAGASSGASKLMRLLWGTVSIVLASVGTTVLLFFFWTTVMAQWSRALDGYIKPDEPSAQTPAVALLLEAAAILGNPNGLQLFTLTNYAVCVLLVVLIVLITYVDAALITFKESLRERAKMPPADTIAYYNHNSYDAALANARKEKRMKRPK